MSETAPESARIGGKTLVTGGAGFIGSHVVRCLLDEGRDVRVMIVPGEDTRNLAGLDVEIVAGDLTDPDSLVAAVKGCARVFHLAAIYKDWLPRPETMYEVNCIGSLNLLWAARRQEVEKLVYTSSVVALGLAASGSADEETPFNAWSANMDYSRSKWLSEQEALTFCRNGLDISFCCPGMPYGAGDIAPTPTGQLLLMAAKSMPRFVPDNYMSVVDVDDVARGHLLAEKKGRNGERYILTNANIKLSEFMQAIAETVGRSARPIGLPPQIMRMAAPIGDYLEQRAWQTGKKPALTGGALRYAALNFRFSNQKAREELGLEFTPMRAAICKAFDWFIRQGRIRNPKFIEDFRNHGGRDLVP